MSDFSLLGIVLVGVFFALRPELFKEIFFGETDARPSGIFRILFGTVTFVTFVLFAPDLDLLFTSDGIFPAELARELYGGGGEWSVFHLRNDPGFVRILYAVLLVSVALMTAGVFTRVTTITSWLLVINFYSHNGLALTGWDMVIQVFLFLGVFLRWGEAFSVDAWRRGTEPSLIPVWPLRLIVIELALIYFMNGINKGGAMWWNGTALFYAMSLDHYVRYPMPEVVAALQRFGVLPVMTYLVHFWEICFPMVLLGPVVKAHRSGRLDELAAMHSKRRVWIARGAALGAVACMSAALGGAASTFHDPEHAFIPLSKPVVAALVTVLGVVIPSLALSMYFELDKRWPRVIDGVTSPKLWLGFGLVMHLGIDLTMNVGLFSLAMLSTYAVYLKRFPVLWPRTAESVPS